MARSGTRPTIAILGGGVGGTILANLLARELVAEEAEIVLVDRSGHHVYQPGWLYIPFGGQDGEHLERKERSLLRDRIKLILGDAQQLDLEKQQILLADHSEQITERLQYDYLVFASGARISPEEVPGLAEALANGDNVHQFYTQRGAERLHDALAEFHGGHIAVAIGGIPYKCPPAPLEFTFMLEAQLRQRGLRNQAEITYYSPLPRAFTIESVSEMAAPLLEERGVKVETFFNLESVNGAKGTMQSMEGQEAPFDLLIMVPPHRGALIAEKSSLTDSQGWLPTDRNTLVVKGQERVFALGDVTDLPVSKSGSAAHFEASVVAEQIIARLRGREVHKREDFYDGRVMCFMETGYAQATRIEFDYEHPPVPPKPSWFYHMEKALFNRAYWYLVPPGRV